MDELSHHLVNRVVGNVESAATLELTGSGPTLRFPTETVVALGGAAMPLTVDGRAAPRWVAGHRPRRLRPSRSAPTSGPVCGRTSRSAAASTPRPTSGPGPRSRSAASAATKVARWRRRRPPDRVRRRHRPGAARPRCWRRSSRTTGSSRVVIGPHGAPDFLTTAGMEAFFRTTWTVHFNSARTGVRLIGPKPAVGPGRRRRRRPAPVEHPRQRLRHRRGRHHRRHAGDPRPRRPQPRRLRVPGGGRGRRSLEDRPAGARRRGAPRAGDPRRGGGGRRPCGRRGSAAPPT